jgi:hypothetical protein
MVEVWGWCYPMGRGHVMKKGWMKEMKSNFTQFASVSGGQDAGEFQYLDICQNIVTASTCSVTEPQKPKPDVRYTMKNT